MERTILQEGDEIRVIAPSHSMAVISASVREIANQRLEGLGLRITFGEHIEEINEFLTSSIESRIADLHEAYRDPQVKAVFAVIGGFASNQLLPHIDWDLIRHNPKRWGTV